MTLYCVVITPSSIVPITRTMARDEHSRFVDFINGHNGSEWIV